MGATTSAIVSEIYLQFMENTKIYDILVKHGIIRYFWYVDILTVHKDKITDIHKVLGLFNEVSPTLSFNIEEEENNSINFLDISIYKNNDICFKMYRKPTATELIIPYNSNRPLENKISAIRYLANSLINYPLNNTDKKKGYDTIKYISHNKYDPLLLDKVISIINTKSRTQQETPPHKQNTRPNGPHLHM